MGGIKTGMKKLKEVIDIINQSKARGEEVTIITINKLTKEQGFGILFMDNKHIKVFEGQADGSDDKVYTLKKFEEKYEIEKIVNENEEEIEQDL